MVEIFISKCFFINLNLAATILNDFYFELKDLKNPMRNIICTMHKDFSHNPRKYATLEQSLLFGSIDEGKQIICSGSFIILTYKLLTEGYYN